MRTTESPRGDWRLQPAGLLDVPFIYELALQGCEEGAYCEAYLSPGGRVSLLARLLKTALLGGKGLLRNLPESGRLLLLSQGQRAAGFCWLLPAPGLSAARIDMFSLASPYQCGGGGTAMLRALLQALPAEHILLAECTPYAAGMKRLLKRNGFRRDRQSRVQHGCVGLDVYRYQSPAAQPHADRARSQTAVA